MKLTVVIFGFLAGLFTTTSAQAGTVGVFRVAEDKIVEVTNDGGQIFIEPSAFDSLQRRAVMGDIVSIGDSNWIIESGSGANLMLTPESQEQSEIEISPAKN